MHNLITLNEIAISQDANGLYCLNDLHKASGGEPRHQPSRWLRMDQIKELITELEGDLGIKGDAHIRSSEQNQVLRVVKRMGRKLLHQG